MLAIQKTVLKYRATLAAKRFACRVAATQPCPDGAPAVTVFISSLNTRYPLELTLRSMTAKTGYPNYRILVGENGSKDGSAEFLQSAVNEFPLTVLSSSVQKLHSQWLDEVSATVTTPYWVAVDSDMLFLGRDWLSDLIRVMESDQELYLLAAERNLPQTGYVEPVSGEVIDTGEAASTWLFCVRTSLRDHLNTSFAFHKELPVRQGGRILCFDTGSRRIREMKALGLRFAFMPRRYRCKYHHFGALSWIDAHTPNARTRAFKAMQLADIRRRLARGIS